MIQKTIKVICDNCGQGIYDFSDIPIRQLLKKADEVGFKVVYTNGGRHEFCDEKCYQEWKRK